MKKIIVVFLLALVCIPLSACAGTRVYTGPWSGQIIDAESKQPIEGAAVVAIWYKYYATPAGDVGRYLDTAETITDKEGKFLLSTKKFLNVPLLRESGAPDFHIFKPGYGNFPTYTKAKFLKGFFEKFTVVELPKIKDFQERDKIFSSMDSTIQEVESKSDYNKIKNFIQMRNEEAQFLGHKQRYQNIEE